MKQAKIQTMAGEKITQIALGKLYPFKGNRTVGGVDAGAIAQLAKSIQELGVQVPAVVRARKEKGGKPEQRLAEAGFQFTTHNNGLHLVVYHDEKVVDFWPTTGRWIARKGKEGWGVKGLIEFLEGKKSRRQESGTAKP